MLWSESWAATVTKCIRGDTPTMLNGDRKAGRVGLGRRFRQLILEGGGSMTAGKTLKLYGAGCGFAFAFPMHEDGEPMDVEEGNATLSGKEDLTDDAMDNMQRMERIQAMTDWGMQTSTSKENISGRVTKTREREQELRCCGRKYGRKSTSHFFESWLWWFYYTSGSRVAFLFFSRFVSSALSYFHPPHPRVSPYLFPSLEQQALATRRSVAWCEPSTTAPLPTCSAQ